MSEHGRVRQLEDVMYTLIPGLLRVALRDARERLGEDYLVVVCVWMDMLRADLAEHNHRLFLPDLSDAEVASIKAGKEVRLGGRRFDTPQQEGMMPAKSETATDGGGGEAQSTPTDNTVLSASSKRT